MLINNVEGLSTMLIQNTLRPFMLTDLQTYVLGSVPRGPALAHCMNPVCATELCNAT